MNTDVFSEDQQKQLTLDLSCEREKVKELEEKLQRLTQEHLDENTALVEQQKKLLALIEKKPASNPDANSLNQKLLETLALYHEAQLQNKRLRDQVEKLATGMQDKDKKIRELQQFEHSYKKHIEQKQSLQATLDQESQLNKTLLSENQNYATELNETKAHADQLERGVQHLRERYEEAQLELTQYRDDYSRAQEAILNLTELHNASQVKIKEYMRELQQIQAEKQEALDELQALSGQFSGLKNKTAEFQKISLESTEEQKKLQSSLIEKGSLLIKLEQEILDIKTKLAKGLDEIKSIESNYIEIVNEKVGQAAQIHDLLRQKTELTEDYQQLLTQQSLDKIRHDETFATMKQAQDEQETRIKIAQQHLGKKLKEVALLNEKIEEQQNRYGELEQSLSQANQKQQELKASFDAQLEHEKKLQEEIYEKCRLAVQESVKSEEKYTRTAERLKVLEDKQQQMQQIFANLGGVFGGEQISQPALPKIHAPEISNELSSPKEDDRLFKVIEEISPSAPQKPFSQGSLFEVEQQRINPVRQTLFD